MRLQFWIGVVVMVIGLLQWLVSFGPLSGLVGPLLVVLGLVLVVNSRLGK